MQIKKKLEKDINLDKMIKYLRVFPDIYSILESNGELYVFYDDKIEMNLEKRNMGVLQQKIQELSDAIKDEVRADLMPRVLQALDGLSLLKNEILPQITELRTLIKANGDADAANLKSVAERIDRELVQVKIKTAILDSVFDSMEKARKSDAGENIVKKGS